MKNSRLSFTSTILCLLALFLTGPLQIGAQDVTGPFPPDQWPATIDPSKEVDFVTTDNVLTAANTNWFQTLRLLSGGDQTTQPITIGGFEGVKVTGNYLNIADEAYAEWADEPIIDILMQVYGDAALLGPNGTPRNFHFLIGALPELAAPIGGSLPVEAKNSQWNWVLFRIENSTRPSDGQRLVGTVAADAQGDFSSGGVNGGTIRMEGVPGLIVRAVAFGQEGAFGSPEQINQFAPPPECDPEPETNVASIDIDADQSNHLVVMNDGDQTVTFVEGVGPTDDQRGAVVPNGNYLNFGITDNYLGKPCNEARTMKICVEFYDDPALAGTTFGPDAYATDAQGGIGFVPEDRRHTLQGTGEWIRRSFTVPAVNLRGVNAGEFTAGPRLAFSAPVAISHFSLGVFRTGDHPLAGQDPLPDCFEDPLICTDAYGNYAELDLDSDLQDGLAPGTSAGDQEMIIEEAGPADDRRTAVRPAFDDGTPGFGHNFLNFAIIDEKFGPSSQPNAHLAICITYYDNPELVGATLRPEVFYVERNGEATFGFTSPDIAVALEGTGTWREAYFEIPEIKFIGVNQGPQAAARFALSDKIHVSRVRYAVIRPCGPFAGQNRLEDCKPAEAPALTVRETESGEVVISWPASATGFVLESTESLSNPDWQPVTDAVQTVDGQSQVTVQPLNTRFFRLRQS